MRAGRPGDAPRPTPAPPFVTPPPVPSECGNPPEPPERGTRALEASVRSCGVASGANGSAGFTTAARVSGYALAARAPAHGSRRGSSARVAKAEATSPPCRESSGFIAHHLPARHHRAAQAHEPEDQDK